MTAATKYMAGAYDALEKAREGEPIFVLLGRDRAGPGTLTEWARLRRNSAFKRFGESADASNKELLAAELRQAQNAEEIALEFDDWRTQHRDQEGVRSAYQDVIKSVEEQAEADRRTRRAKAVAHLREAAYNLCEARDILRDLGIGEDTYDALSDSMATANQVAEEHTATRPQFNSEPVLPLNQGEQS